MITRPPLTAAPRTRAAVARCGVSLLAAVLVHALATTAAAQNVFTPHDVARLRVVVSAAIAPDGSEIAYVLTVPRIPFEDEDGTPWEELHLVRPDGTSRPFVTGQVNVGGVRWSPDGRALGFLARRAGDDTRSLYLIGRDGGEARRVLAHETDITAFEFSPDGHRIAFLARQPTPKARQDLARRGFTQEIFEEALQPVRAWTAPVRDDGTIGSARLIDLPGSASVLAWAPQGDRLMIIYAPTALVDDDLMMRRVHVVDAARGTLVTRIDNPGKIGRVAWSPDGSTLAMVSAEDVHDPSEGRLMVVPAAGGTLRDLMPDYQAHVRAIAWQDDDRLLWMSDDGVDSVVGEVRRDGSARRTIVARGGPIFTAMEHAGNGVVALVGDTPRHPSEVFVLPQGEGAPRRLTSSNPRLETMRFAPQEVIQFRARDGVELEGVLIRPLDEQPGRRYPLILTVHGGPEARDANGWRTSYANPGQLAAAQGFAVFYPNYRGSTGRGVEFSRLGQGDPAGREFDDLVDAIDHLVQIGLVDRDTVGITGGSYGGYASAWGATYYTERFAAAVMFVGISNKISKVGTTDIANEVELYRYLKLHDRTPVRLVWYPGEGHGNRRAASRLDYNLRLMQWMQHYLQGPGGDPPPYDLDYKRHLQTETRRSGSDGASP